MITILKDEREKPLLFKRQKVVRFLISPKKKKVKIAKDRKVIPDPIDDRKFQEWKESGKSGILLGITLNPRKCIGEKVRRIPINVETKW